MADSAHVQRTQESNPSSKSGYFVQKSVIQNKYASKQMYFDNVEKAKSSNLKPCLLPPDPTLPMKSNDTTNSIPHCQTKKKPKPSTEKDSSAMNGCNSKKKSQVKSEFLSENIFTQLSAASSHNQCFADEEGSSETSSEDDNYENAQNESIDDSNAEGMSDASEVSSVNEESQFTTVTRKKRKISKKSTFVLPTGVEVICEHFQAHPLSSKVCKGCESKCFFAFFNKMSNRWEKVRPYPKHLNNEVEFHHCFRYQEGKSCKKNCVHSHGPELMVWNIERQGGLPLPKSCLRNTSRKETSSKAKKRRSRNRRQVKGNAIETPQQASTTQHPSTNQQETTYQQPSTNQQETTHQQPSTNQQETTNQQPSTNQRETTSITSASSISHQESSHAQSLQQKHSQEQNICYLPKGVSVVCRHFIVDFTHRELGTTQRKNICKQCRASRVTDVKYAFWSKKFSRWFLVRSRPTNVQPNVAFRDCTLFIRGEKCSKDPCTFGHGPETMMWTMEREGVLAVPEKAIHCVIKDESLDRASIIRPLPPMDGNVKLCQSVKSGIPCRFGRGCHDAHSNEELIHWQEDFREKAANTSQQQHCQGGQQQQKDQIMEGVDGRLPRQQPYKDTEKLPGVELRCYPENPNVILTETGDRHQHQWIFCIRYKVENSMNLPMVFLGKRHSGYFRLNSVSINAIKDNNMSQQLLKKWDLTENKLLHFKPNDSVLNSLGSEIEVKVVVEFRCNVFASFTQSVLFDFGEEPLLKKEFNIDVLSNKGMDDTIRQLTAVRKTFPFLDFDENKIVRMTTNEEESQLFTRYSLPNDVEGIVSAQMVDNDGTVTPDHYVQVMHQLLYSEEAHMKSLLASLIPSDAKIKVTKSYSDESKGFVATSNGEFYGTIDLQTYVTPDDMAGRICTRNVKTVLLQPRGDTHMYEAPIEVLKEDQVIVKLSPRLCQDLKIEQEEQQVDVQMWFNLNREVLCKMHKALDSLTETHKRILFPIGQSVKRQKEIVPPWLAALDKGLNENQLQVISAITEVQSPAPVVVFGPFGTGKTFTLNRAILHLVTKQNNRVLVCTHTNSAADIHVESLDEYIQKHKVSEAKPLRVYDPYRKVSTASQVAQKYGLIKNDAFALPSRQDINKHKVVITTLVTSYLLTKLDVRHGFFTHILIDEAAQAWETEAVIPISLAGPNTKVVLTGDHIQMSPEVYTKFSSRYSLKKSLPERLFDHYSQIKTETETACQDDHLFFLNINYRNNSEIIKFPSDNFYGGGIIAMSDKESPAHPYFGPLMFFTSRGNDCKQHDNTYLNKAEVSEVVKRVRELVQSWPECWGNKVLKDIAVLAPYKYQVKAIRGELRKVGLRKVTVDTIHNVQGMEFRALFISTVRTCESVKDLDQPLDNLSLEFLSDPKLLVTAITRAKSFVAVVGDPVSLCTLGDCRHLWKDFILRCAKLGKLHGITTKELKSEIDACLDLSKTLNPEAAPFVPRKTPVIENGRAKCNPDIAIPEEEEDDIEESCDQSSTISSDADDEFEDDVDLKIEDPPRHIDKIINALVNSLQHGKKREVSSVKLASPRSSSLPSLEDEMNSSPTETEVELIQHPRGLTSSDYEMIRINGRDVMRLVSPYRVVSDRARNTCKYSDNIEQDHLSPEALNRMIQDQPSRYVIGQLRVGVDRSRTSYIEFRDKMKPDIKISGNVKKAFDRDTVVIDTEKLPAAQGLDSDRSCNRHCVVGVLHHLINPRERQYVCKLDDTQQNNNALMVPINKSVPKIVNFSHQSHGKIPLYRKVIKDKEKLFVVKKINYEVSRRNDYLFLVQFLQWRGDCYYPLGIALRTFERGEDIRDCLKIVDAEHGIRRADETKAKEEVNSTFPKTWQIPQFERRHREKVNNAFTIDPEESRDLDDAISVDRLQDGTYKIGIHIADVSYFVKPDSEVDQDARKRGTTYYTGNSKNRACEKLPWFFENVPMLPRSLSENHCSLLEKEERLTQTVYVKVDSCGRVLNFPTEIKSTITRSRCQLTYSDAQRIIEGCSPRKETEEADLELLNISIPLLHGLAQNFRTGRLGSICHRDEKDDVAAHELVEEMMILANQAAGRILSTNRDKRSTTPFVSHLEPKVHRLNKWANDYGKYARYHPSTKKYLESEDIQSDVQRELFSEESDQRNIMIFKSCWNEFLENVSNRNYAMLGFLIARPDCSPQLQLANQSVRLIQKRSEYRCPSGDEEISHHDLALKNYVHFTSPIRRYMDIEIHRRLKSVEEEHDIKEVEKFCRRSTFIKDNSRKFQKECKRIFFAHNLKAYNEGLEVIVDKVDRHSFVVHAVDPEQDLFSRNNNRISYQELSVIYEPEEPVEDLGTTLTWRVRIYIGPSVEENTPDGEIRGPQYREKELIKNLLLSVAPNDTSVRQVFQVEGRKWLQLIEASQRENNAAEIDLLVKDIQNDLQLKSVISPYIAQAVDVEPFDEEGHYYTITMILKPFDIIHVQLFPRLSLSVLTPDIQLFKVSSNLHICVEHRRLPRICFAKRHIKSESKSGPYNNLNDYISHWEPLLAMELANQAVSHNEGFVLKSHLIKWRRQDSGKIEGKFSLKESYCKARQLDFKFGDLACVRIQKREEESVLVDVASLQNTKEASSAQNIKGSRWILVCHCVFKEVKNNEESHVWNVTLLVNNITSEMPETLLDGNGHVCDLEVIQVPVPIRRMNVALNSNLEKSTDLVQSICCGWKLKETNYSIPSDDLSIASYYDKFHPLNEFQKASVEKALQKSFSLIQGPPGTGKTVTGVHIAYWFTKQNLELENGNDRSHQGKEDGEDKTAMPSSNTPPQVLYCGPSNKSVDVVTEYLLRIPNIKEKILRVYGSMIEETEYPIPNKLTRLKPPVSDDELKIPEDELKEISLHHVIRRHPCPYWLDLKRMEDSFRESKENNVRPSDEDVTSYLKLISDAEEWAIVRRQIILCTCSRSGRKLITENCNIMQCIVDESGMCTEPEVLVPLTSSKARQIVLIGDHKQLQPIVTDREACRLGLATSMFERLHEEAELLRIQYRMHEAICAFPSAHFYNSRLITDETVKNRTPSTGDFWPAPRYGPIVFCNVEGEERSSVVSTAESGTESKYNKEEANKAVEVAKYLVNKHDVKKTDVVILTPYREQRKLIADQLKGAYSDIRVTTIIKSQGSEWDYVIISLVRSLPDNNIDSEPSLSWLSDHLGFLRDEHQINVALTRAKYGLCIIGNRKLISLDKTWNSLIEHYEEKDCIVEHYDLPPR